MAICMPYDFRCSEESPIIRRKAYGRRIGIGIPLPHMTPDQIHLVRKSFAHIEPKAQIAAICFYRRLFELAPEFRPLFKRSIEEQSAGGQQAAGADGVRDRQG